MAIDPSLAIAYPSIIGVGMFRIEVWLSSSETDEGASQIDLWLFSADDMPDDESSTVSRSIYCALTHWKHWKSKGNISGVAFEDEIMLILSDYKICHVSYPSVIYPSKREPSC